MSIPEERTAQRQFALQVYQEMMRVGATRVSYDPDEFVIRYNDGMVLNLSNIFQQVRDFSAEERRAEVERFVAAMLAPALALSSWDQVRPLLRPVLRPCTYMLEDSDSRLQRPAFPFIDEMVAIDEPGRIRLPAQQQLVEWGVGAEEVFEAARQNLAETVITTEFDEGAIVRIVVDDPSYLPSWLLVPGWLAACTRSYRHRPVAFIPDYTSLIVAPGDPELLEHLYQTVEQEVRDAARPLSPQAYTVDDNGMVVPLDRAITGPLPPAVDRARTLLAYNGYEAQRDWLQQKYNFDAVVDGDFDDDESASLFVADIMIRQEKEDSSPQMVTVWGEGVHSSLPEADYIAFACEDMEQTIIVPFQAAVEITGITPIPGFRPTRYRAVDWPDHVTWSRLSEAAVTTESMDRDPRSVATSGNHMTSDYDGFVGTSDIVTDIVYRQVVDSERTARTILAERLTDSPLTALQDVAPHFLGLAGYFSRGDFGESSGIVRSHADSAANALVARLQSARRPVGDGFVSMIIGDDTYQIPATGGTSPPLPASDFLSALWISVVTRNPRLLMFLLGSADRPGYPLAETNDYASLWGLAWQQIHCGAPAVHDTLHAAQSAAKAAGDEYATRCAAPAIQALQAAVSGTATEFNTAFLDALWQYRGFSGTNERSLISAGFVAWHLLALACFATDRGLPLTVASDYLPPALLDRAWTLPLADDIIRYPNSTHDDDGNPLPALRLGVDGLWEFAGWPSDMSGGSR
ncbi:Imm49 family immunity protein [Nocardia exalbida]|uniref:Imm49 family immunity protein n=1 Tax=Nocardia exalbida TaxID=290231 RepID=UPI0002FFBE58|nr:Imm49 family immunity protein [Nocardia exalbida]